MSNDLAKQISKIDNWQEFTLGSQAFYRGETRPVDKGYSPCNKDLKVHCVCPSTYGTQK